MDLLIRYQYSLNSSRKEEWFARKKKPWAQATWSSDADPMLKRSSYTTSDRRSGPLRMLSRLISSKETCQIVIFGVELKAPTCDTGETKSSGRLASYARKKSHDTGPGYERDVKLIHLDRFFENLPQVFRCRLMGGQIAAVEQVL